MAQITCPHCGAENHSVAVYCAKCERPMRQAATPTSAAPPALPIKNAPPPRAKLGEVAGAANARVASPPPLAARAAPPSAPPASTPPAAPPAAAKPYTAPPTAPKPQAAPSAPPPRPATPVAVAPVAPVPQSIHEVPTVVAPVARQSIHEDPTVVYAAPPPAGAIPPAAARPQARETAETFGQMERFDVPRAAAPAPTPKSLPVDTDDTVIGASKAPYWRLLGAFIIDLVLILGIGAAWIAVEMVLAGGHWPTGGIDDVAGWLHMYPHTVRRSVSALLAAGVAYAAVSGHSGKTLGRLVFRLSLVRTSGKALNWAVALWRAAVSVVSIAFFGAGFFWTVVDSRNRCWHDVLSASVVVALDRPSA